MRVRIKDAVAKVKRAVKSMRNRRRAGRRPAQVRRQRQVTPRPTRRTQRSKSMSDRVTAVAGKQHNRVSGL
jgi:hypothetical protein